MSNVAELESKPIHLKYGSTVLLVFGWIVFLGLCEAATLGEVMGQLGAGCEYPAPETPYRFGTGALMFLQIGLFCTPLAFVCSLLLCLFRNGCALGKLFLIAMGLNWFLWFVSVACFNYWAQDSSNWAVVWVQAGFLSVLTMPSGIGGGVVIGWRKTK